MKYLKTKLKETVSHTNLFSHTSRMITCNYFRPKDFNDIQYLWNYFKISKRYLQLDNKKLSPTSIPVVFVNFNRHTPLKQFLAWLMSLKHNLSFIILDNASTYQPLLKFYDEIETKNNIQVIRLPYNFGIRVTYHLSQLLSSFDYYIVSDPDLIPYGSTPTNIIDVMIQTLEDNPSYNHVGPSLEINDIPSNYSLRSKVLNQEKQFWPPEAPQLSPEAIIAKIDTTFALYRSQSSVLELEPAIRLNRPYTLKHVDWYHDCNRPFDREYKYYVKQCSHFASWSHKYLSVMRSTER